MKIFSLLFLLIAFVLVNTSSLLGHDKDCGCKRQKKHHKHCHHKGNYRRGDGCNGGYRDYGNWGYGRGNNNNNNNNNN
jgi:hypothetical protein